VEVQDILICPLKATIVKPLKAAFAREWLGKHVSLATNMHAII
jgi:hypothetical protein